MACGEESKCLNESEVLCKFEWIVCRPRGEFVNVLIRSCGFCPEWVSHCNNWFSISMELPLFASAFSLIIVRRPMYAHHSRQSPELTSKCVRKASNKWPHTDDDVQFSLPPLHHLIIVLMSSLWKFNFHWKSWKSRKGNLIKKMSDSNRHKDFLVLFYSSSCFVLLKITFSRSHS